MQQQTADNHPLRATKSFPEGAPQRESYDTDLAHARACDAYEHEKAAEGKPFPSLTEREREVAQQLCLGLKNREIAEAFQISIKTVDTHRGHILRKLEVRNNVELIRLAIRSGWTTVEVES